MNPLHSIAYVSTATARLATSASLDALLVDARAFNLDCGVTGALLHHGGNFFQYIEGPPESVRKVYARIQKSSGHTSLYELLNGPARERHFGSWTMGFAEPVRSALQRVSHASWTREFAHARQHPAQSPGMVLLLDFWARSGQAP